MRKTIEIPNGDVTALISSIDNLFKSGIKLPVKILYSINVSRNKLLSSAKSADEVRLKLVEMYGEQSEDGKNTVVSEANMAQFQKDYMELMNTKTEVEVRMIMLSALEAIGEMQAVENLHVFMEYLIEDDLNE